MALLWGGRSLSWIGVTYSTSACAVPCRSVILSIPRPRIVEALEFCREAVRCKALPISSLRSGAGKCQSIANIIPTLRPFCSYLWGALSNQAPAFFVPGAKTSKRRHVSHWVNTTQARHGLKWLLRFFSGREGPITRAYRHLIPESDWLVISVDASPWGLGGVLMANGTPVAWFADWLHNEDVTILAARRADPAFQTAWEALAILVAVRLWLSPLHDGVRVEIRSDSFSAMSASIRGASRSPTVRRILCELALDDAELVGSVNLFTHIPGVSNKWPDALSRLYSPEATLVPPQLQQVPRTQVPVRTILSFWRSLQCVSGESEGGRNKK